MEKGNGKIVEKEKREAKKEVAGCSEKGKSTEEMTEFARNRKEWKKSVQDKPESYSDN